MLHSEQKLLMMLLRCMGVLSIACVVDVAELCTYACAYTVAPYSHALTRDNYCTSCTDVKRRVYETLQREQNGGSSWLGHG